MPKIQLHQDQIGLNTPQPARGAANVSGTTAGLDAISQLGQVGADIALQVRNNRESVEAAKATTAAIKEIEETAFHLMNEDQDYGTQMERYGKTVKEIEGRVQERFKGNGRIISQVKQNLDLFAFRKGLDVKSSALRGDMEQQKALLVSALDDTSGIAIRGDQEHYDEQVEKGLALIDQSYESGVLDTAERESMEQQFRNGLSRGKVRQDITADPEQALANIRENSYSALSPEEQSMFESMAITAIEQNKNKNRHAMEKYSKELVTDTITAYESGFEVSPDEFEAAKEAAALVGRSEDLQIARAASEFMLLPKAKREDLPSQLQGVDNAEMRKALVYANEVIDREINKDGYAFAVKQGVVGKVEIDLQDPTTVQARLEQVDYLKTHYGKDISPLTNDEVDALVTALPAMPPKAKVQLAQAFGPSQAIWKQLDEKNAGTFAMVGAMGDPDTMTKVFQGQQLLADKLVELPEDRSTMLARFDDVVGDIYVGRDRKAMFDAASAYYAAQNGPDAAGGWFANDSFEDAIQAVSGGIGVINGQKVELPRDVEEDTFEDFVDQISPETVAHFGGVWSMSNEKAAELIRESSVRSIGANQYIVERDGAILMRPDGRQFVFSYDPELFEQDAERRRQTDRAHTRQQFRRAGYEQQRGGR